MSAPSTIHYLTLDSQPLVHGGVRYLLGAFSDLQLPQDGHDHSLAHTA